MKRIHISKKGLPATCTAAEGQCPLNSEHFNTVEEAHKSIENNLLEEFGGAFNQVSKFDMPPNFEMKISSYTDYFKLNSETKPESKNKGEYSELYAAYYLLNGRKIFTPTGVKPLSINSMRLYRNDSKKGSGDGYYVDYRVNVDSEGLRSRFINKEDRTFSYEVLDKEDHDQNIFNFIKKGNGRSFKSSYAIQQACVELGFEDGMIPKADSKHKADLVGWDDNGEERRISVKSFIGSEPGLINQSKQSAMTFKTKIPDNVDEEEIKDLLNKMEGQPTKRKVAMLKRMGVNFDPVSGTPVSKAFKNNLDTVDGDNARAAYSAAIWGSVESKYEVPDHLKNSYRNVLHGFASKMTHSEIVSDDKAVTDWMIINKDGRATVYNFKNEQETGKFFERRVKFSEGNKQRDKKTGSFEIKDGHIEFYMNTVGVFYERPIN